MPSGDYKGSTKLVTSPSILPLDLLDFSGSLLPENKILLQWKTGNENNTDHFEIEYSSDGQFFTKIDTKQAIGFGNNNYDFSLINNGNVRQYYRLRIVDKNGDFVYSNTITLIIGNTAQKIVVYPNPASKMLMLSHAAAMQGAILQIISAEGKIVLTKKITLGDMQTIVDVSSIKTGWYVVNLFNGTNKESAIFLKR